jgi:hypothetical protein
MKGFIKIALLVFAAMAILLIIGSCTGDKGPAGPPGLPAVSNAICLSSSCHGDTSAQKIIVTESGTREIVPLYVNNTLYTAGIHGSQLCVSCHTDINASGGAHADVRKVFGGWAQFSAGQEVESWDIGEVVRTRNYSTAASYSCITCHKAQANFMNSAHATIFKLRSARMDADLSARSGTEIGEDYTPGECNRCHATCATCHFKSTVSQNNPNGNALQYWDRLQASYPNVSGWDDAMVEFSMDWTTNVASHEFRGANYFASDSGRVCEACHTGYQGPATTGYWWVDKANSIWDSIKVTYAGNHPQTYEPIISGDPSYRSGGHNTAHAAMKCDGCHGGSYGNVHNLPGIPYNWESGGDVQCIDCHPHPNHTTSSVALHYDNVGIKVACIGCHTFGLARDFDPSGDGHDVFIDPATGEVRPVAWDVNKAIVWYSHNWQTLNPGTGMTDPNGDCAKKCHYVGNKVGAPTS